MQIVIDIDDKVYGLLKYFENGFGFDDKDDKKDDDVKTALMRAVLNGTPLPKRHGKLKDMGNLKYVFDLTKDNPIYSGKDIEQAIKSMTTIIEADKAESEDKE